MNILWKIFAHCPGSVQFDCKNLYPQPFANGAMRECFRAKKLSKFAVRSPEEDWHLPFANVVAKKYFKDSDRYYKFYA